MVNTPQPSAKLLAWSQSLGIQPVKSNDTAVILHLFYADMWDEILGYLSNLGHEFDLYVTVPTGSPISEASIRSHFPGAQVYRCENRGRDVAPFLVIYTAIAGLGYKYICKIHSKKSFHVSGGAEWRQDMLSKMLGSPGTVLRIKQAFDENPHWGLIAPKGHVVPQEYFWRQNSAHVTQLAHAAGISLEGIRFYFVAGNMFWFRPEAFYSVLRVAVSLDDFEPERGQQDSTLAHAFERFLGLATIASGYEIAESDPEGVRPAEVSIHFQLLYEAYEKHELLTKQRLQSLQKQLMEKDDQLVRLQGGRADRAGAAGRHIRNLLLPPDSRQARAGRNLAARPFFPFSLYREYTIRRDAALIRKSGLFDEAWYVAENPEVADSHMDPARHFLLEGGLKGLNPGPAFNSQGYLDAYEDVRAGGANPLLHYLRYGKHEGRAPDPVAIYSAERPAANPTGPKDHDRRTRRNPLRAAVQKILRGFRSVYRRLPLSASLRQNLMQAAYKYFPGAYTYYKTATNRLASQDFSAYRHVPASRDKAAAVQGKGYESNLAFAAWLLETKESALRAQLVPAPWHVEPIETGASEQGGPKPPASVSPDVQFTVLLMVNDPPAHFLRNSIESVRRQTYSHWHLDICTDPAAGWNADVLALNFGGTEPRIRLSTIRTAGNPWAQLRAAVAASQGDYIVVLSPYDELGPDALSQAAVELSVSTCDLAYGPADPTITRVVGEADGRTTNAPGGDFDAEIAFCQFIAWRKPFLEQLLAESGSAQGQDIANLQARSREQLKPQTAKPLSEPCYLFRQIPGRGAFQMVTVNSHVELQSCSVPLRVLMDARLLTREVSGTERYILELLGALSSLRQEYNLHLSALVATRPRQPIEGVEFITSSLLEAIQHCDVYHKAFPATDGSNLAEMALAPAVVLTPLDLILFTNQDYFPHPSQYYHYRAIMRSAASLSNRIISISEHGKMEIETLLGVPEPKVEPIYLGVRPEHFKSEAHSAEMLASLKLPDNYFLYVGTDYPHKNLLTLLRAFQLVRQKASSADLVVVGLNYYAHVQPELNHLLVKLGGHVHRLGHVPDSVLPALYHHSIALVYPSLYEGFGLPLLEAMLCETPVIASNATSIPEVTGKEAAILVDGRSEQQIAEAMLRVWNDSELRSQLISAGTQRAGQFTWRETARNTIRCYYDAVRDALQTSSAGARNRKLELVGALRDPAPAILFISHVRFYPPAAGNEQRLFRVVKYLKKLGYRIVMLVNPLSEDHKLDREALKVIYRYVDYYEEIGEVAVDDSPKSFVDSPIGKEPILERWRATEQGFCSDAMLSRAAQLIEEYSPKILVSEYIWSSRVFAAAKPDMLKVIDTIDVFSHKNENVVKFGIQDPLTATPAEELAFINRSDVIIAIQDSEAEAFRALQPSCDVITAGIDLDVIDGRSEVKSKDTDLPLVLMVGSGNHINVHCAKEFLEQAWPAIRQSVPNCRLKIVGKVCNSLTTKDPSVALIPYVPDLDPTYREATLVVNPVYAGTGIKVKSVEALGHGKALVSWPEGLAGLTAGVSQPFVMIHSWQELADAVVGLIRDPQKRQDLEAASRDYARATLTDQVVYRALADRFDAFCNRKLNVLCLYLRYGTHDYPQAIQELQNWHASNMSGMDVTTWIIDNQLEHDFDGTDLDTGYRLLSGDNEQWEFSGFQKILAEHRLEIEAYDVIHFVTSAFNTLYTEYLNHFSAEELQLVAHRPICLGHMDSYDEPVQIMGATSQSWIRTCFFFASPETAYSIPSFVSFHRTATFFGAKGAFLEDESLSDNYRKYITAWLSGEAIQGVSWHSRTLDSRTFARKALAILNEHMLSHRLRGAGIHLVDFYWLMQNREVLRSPFGYSFPDWSEQVSIRKSGLSGRLSLPSHSSAIKTKGTP